ncbi:EEF1A lysine methyltransferase 1-like [Ctenocephalides felis]|uniref:EEF1A lysine methyltransferase 1-like n=1 Tax=Ctenocephalides felis TaxID=7515 RepID=UPI000E6E309A|nr:EEF1A lysine methyltransferase 1-like [Ctenocephalides felis]
MDDDDVPQLSAETFNILQQFYAEQAAKEDIISKQNDEKIEFHENWQLSQFWYDDNTIQSLVNIIINSVDEGAHVALISCPSLYKHLKENCTQKNIKVKLLEYDKRFAVHEDFVFYDYNEPLNLPKELEKYFDLVIMDPPFLAEECLTKASKTAKHLSKHKIILCTGATMEELANKELGVKRTGFVPHHKNNLGNEFCCYSNYELPNKF